MFNNRLSVLFPYLTAAILCVSISINFYLLYSRDPVQSLKKMTHDVAVPPERINHVMFNVSRIFIDSGGREINKLQLLNERCAKELLASGELKRIEFSAQDLELSLRVKKDMTINCIPEVRYGSSGQWGDASIVVWAANYPMLEKILKSEVSAAK